MAGMNNQPNHSKPLQTKTNFQTCKAEAQAARTPEIARPTHQTTPEHDPNLPHWLPVGDDWDGLPKSIRQAVPQILAPAYRRFVVKAPGELERSFGLTLVHLMWLELCDQAKFGAATDPNSLDAVLGNAEQLTERHLHLVSAKCQTAELLVKLRLLSETSEAGPLRREARFPASALLYRRLRSRLRFRSQRPISTRPNHYRLYSSATNAIGKWKFASLLTNSRTPRSA